MRYAFVLYSGIDREYKRVEYNFIENVSQRLDIVKSLIGCEYIEVVNIPALTENSCLLIDEEGLLHEKKDQLNYIASVLYGTAKHGHPIVGNVLLCCKEWGEDGYDTVGFDSKTADKIEELLLSMKSV